MLDGLRPWWIGWLRMSLGGVYPCIYSPVGCASTVGSNRLNQGLRCIRRGDGGSFQKRRAKTLRGAPAGAMVGPAGPTWQPLGPRCSECLLDPSWVFPRRFPWQISFVLFCTRVPLFSFSEIHLGKYRTYKTRGNCQIKPYTCVFSCFPSGLKLQ